MYYKLVDRQVVELTRDEVRVDKFDLTTQVLHTSIEDNNDIIIVSTIFMCMTHRKDAFGNPFVFETMIFGGEYNGYQKRYTTYDDAEKGHQETIEMIFDV